MTKKNFKGGINGLIQSSINDSNSDDSNNILNQNEKYIPIYFKIPEQLKIDIDIYCAKNRLSKQDLVISVL